MSGAPGLTCSSPKSGVKQIRPDGAGKALDLSRSLDLDPHWLGLRRLNIEGRDSCSDIADSKDGLQVVLDES